MTKVNKPVKSGGKVPASELSTIKMSCRTDQTFHIVIDEGTVKQWVGIGWIDLREATKDDYTKYPEVER